MKSMIKMKLLAVLLIALAAIQTMFVSCSDEPDRENYYTTTSHYATSFLQQNEQYSLFVQILDRAQLLGLLGTYGSYTVFAPTNDAVNLYLAKNGFTSVAEMSDSLCKDVAYNHVIDGAAYYTTDIVGSDSYENMLYHPLTVSIDSDTVSIPGEIILDVRVNHSAKMIQMDDSVENGVIHTMAQVIGTDNDLLPALIARDSLVTLFYEAMETTHMIDSLQKFKDFSYSIGKDSINWNNKTLVKLTATEYDNVAYPKERRYKFTVFCPTDEVLKEKYGVTDIPGLTALAHQLYDPAFPEDAAIADPTDRRNALNRFVSYHMLDRMGKYWMLTCMDGGQNTLAKNFNRRNWDIADWYETMMPTKWTPEKQTKLNSPGHPEYLDVRSPSFVDMGGSILKCSFPSGSQAGLYLNRRGIMNHPDKVGHFVRGAKLTPPEQVKVSNECLNGVYHYIDDIISYDLFTQDELFRGERLRIDCSTLSPDFMNQTGYGGSYARGHYTLSDVEGGKYGVWDDNSDITNKQLCLGFKSGSAKNFGFDDNTTHLRVRPRTLGFWSYQGDELCVQGPYDITILLPPVPEGDYELRMFTCVEFDTRGIVQFYIDEVPQGIPFDMRSSGSSTKIGWQAEGNDPEQNAAFDKQFHYRGWMKGPKAYSFDAGSTSSRELDRTLRRVIGTFHSHGKEHHTLRMQQKMKGNVNNTCDFDMIELCPSTIYNNPDLAEDVW